MVGWVFTAVLTVFIGIYFFVYNLFNGYPYFSLSLSYTLFIFMVIVPILTMRPWQRNAAPKQTSCC